AREQRPEQHDLRGKKEPDADLAVGQTGIPPDLYGVRNFHLDQASYCGTKSFAAPGTLYSYGPRYACGTVAKLPCGGGEGAAHSIVVACHGFSSTFFPFQMLQKKLKMNGIWNSAMIHAPQEDTTFRCSTGCANWYACPPSNRRRETPCSPTMNIGMKTTFMQTSEPNQWILPSVSFIFRPVAFGNQ